MSDAHGPRVATRRRLVTTGALLAVAVVGAAGIAAAATHRPSATPAATAPIETLAGEADWLDGPVEDFTDPSVGAFAFESGFVGAAELLIANAGAIEPTPDGLAGLFQDAYDSLLHMRPDLPLTHATDTGHPDFTPDWDHDGVYGEAEDYTHDVDHVPDVAPFRFPRLGLDGSVTFDGGTGVVAEMKVVNSRGFVLDATVWLPGDPAEFSSPVPSVVFNDGLASRQDHYYWYAMVLAGAGYAVLTYDPTGQGESEGTFADLFAEFDGCSGSCMDAQDMARWWEGDTIGPVAAGQSRPFLGFHDPRYTTAGGDNVPNPYLSLLDPERVSMSGNSLGALATVSYLNALTDGTGYDGTGRPVPALTAAVPLSIPGETRLTSPVPVLTMSGDFDGFPLVGPAPLGLGWADDHVRMHATLRGDDTTTNAVGVVIIEGAVHTDHIDQAFVPSTSWGLAVIAHYAVAWFDCHARGDTAACDLLTQPIPHLSRAFATQYDADGSGPAPNVCVQAPDQASLGQGVEVLLAALTGQHAACPT